MFPEREICSLKLKFLGRLNPNHLLTVEEAEAGILAQ